MAFADTLAQSQSTLAARFRSGFADWREARARRAQYQRIYNELSRLTPRELADIGITTGQIAETAAKAAKLI